VFVKLSPLQQFWLNLLLPLAGLALLNWTPGNVLFCFILEMCLYALFNFILVVFMSGGLKPGRRLYIGLLFILGFIIGTLAFFILIGYFFKGADPSMQVIMTPRQRQLTAGIYILHFFIYLIHTRPFGKINAARLQDEVSYRFTRIFGLLFLILICFSFLRSSPFINYILVLSLIVAKGYVDFRLTLKKWKASAKRP
jgi:Family of unknown function (DUF6498)